MLLCNADNCTKEQPFDQTSGPVIPVSPRTLIGFVANSHLKCSTTSEFVLLVKVMEVTKVMRRIKAAFITQEAENIQARRLTVHAQIKDVTSCE